MTAAIAASPHSSLKLLLLPLSLSIAISHATSTTSTTANTSSKCERLTSLTYFQSAAPSDISAILSLIHAKINADVADVVGINVEWGGTEIHRRVGERVVKSIVTREAGGDGDSDSDSDVNDGQHGHVTQCFEVPFTILDVDECTIENDGDSDAVAGKYSWSHQCREPSFCVNTLGSYECVCPLLHGVEGIGAQLGVEDFWSAIAQQSRSPWELSLASSAESSCPGQSSTHQCCDPDGHSKEGANCRSSFVCPSDPCAGKNKCANNASCERKASPLSHPNYECVCPKGTLGNGRECTRSNKRHEPKVKFDGVTPTEETQILLDKGLICGCVVPVVDGCSGFKCTGKHETCTISSENEPTCACKRGYVPDPKYGCVDENPPVLHIRPYPGRTDQKDPTVARLTQGDRYEEHGVDVIDENAEEYLRTLQISYNRPLPQGCLLEMGRFEVNYTVATPWTAPDHVRAKRTVIIENVDECRASEVAGVGRNCPELVAMCDTEAGATCVDRSGTYGCQCPEGTEGDGFLPIARLRPDGKGGYVGSMVPMNYGGGTGCRDTSRPVIEVLGPNPKKVRVAKVAGLKGEWKKMEDDRETSVKIESLLADRRSYYENEIRFIIKASSGAELCATSSNPNVRPTDCIRATDHTYKGVVDLSSRVSIGEPVATDGLLQWRVPYNVADDAGNKAKTVWRDIVVEEVDLGEFEQKTRAAIQASRKEEVDYAVKKALAEERTRVANSGPATNRESAGCPKCEACSCNGKGTTNGMSASECDSKCERKVAAAVGSVAGGTGTCANESFTALSRHPWILAALDWTEELIGPDALVFFFMSCIVCIGVFLVWRVVSALFFSTGPDVRTYYHSVEDDEREKMMSQNVTYYRSPSSSTEQTRQPVPGSATPLGPRPPPTATLSSQRNGIFSPQQQPNANGATQQQYQSQTQQYTSPFRTEDGTDNIYQMKSPITPTRNTPAQSARSYNLRSHH